MLPDPGARDPLRTTLRALQQGVAALIPDGTVLQTTRGPLPKAQILAELSDALAAYAELDAHRRAARQALLQIETAAAANRRLAQQLKDLLLGYFGRGDARLGQFGMALRAGPRPLTSEAMVLRAQRVRDTRALRHTMGKRQKAAIKGEGTYSLTVHSGDVQPTAPAPTAPPVTKVSAG
jgi:hypothetical protein